MSPFKPPPKTTTTTTRASSFNNNAAAAAAAASSVKDDDRPDSDSEDSDSDLEIMQQQHQPPARTTTTTRASKIPRVPPPPSSSTSSSSSTLNNSGGGAGTMMMQRNGSNHFGGGGQHHGGASSSSGGGGVAAASASQKQPRKGMGHANGMNHNQSTAGRKAARPIAGGEFFFCFFVLSSLLFFGSSDDDEGRKRVLTIASRVVLSRFLAPSQSRLGFVRRRRFRRVRLRLTFWKNLSTTDKLDDGPDSLLLLLLKTQLHSVLFFFLFLRAIFVFFLSWVSSIARTHARTTFVSLSFSFSLCLALAFHPSASLHVVKHTKFFCVFFFFLLVLIRIAPASYEIRFPQFQKGGLRGDKVNAGSKSSFSPRKGIREVSKKVSANRSRGNASAGFCFSVTPNAVVFFVVLENDLVLFLVPANKPPNQKRREPSSGRSDTE